MSRRSYDVSQPHSQPIELTDFAKRLTLLAATDNNNSYEAKDRSSSFNTGQRSRERPPSRYSNVSSWLDQSAERHLLEKQPPEQLTRNSPAYYVSPRQRSRYSNEEVERTPPNVVNQYHQVEADGSNDQSRRCSCARSPQCWFAVSCFLSVVTFSFSVNTDLLPRSVSLALGSLLPVQHITVDPEDRRVILIIILWGVHFLRRFAEIFFVHVYRRDVTTVEAILFIVHYTGFGFWIGWSVNYFNAYWVPNNYFFVPGVFLFLVGETGNCVGHVQLMRMRTGKTLENQDQESRLSHLVIPTRGLFRHIVCPHYMFEMVTWVGFTLATFTMACVIFCFLNIVSLVVYARLRKIAYLEVFDGRNGRSLFDRKMLIPKLC